MTRVGMMIADRWWCVSGMGNTSFRVTIHHRIP
jgi:hypothetical protein